MGSLSICGLFNIIGIVVMTANVIIFITFIKVAKEEWESSIELFLTLGFIGLQILTLFILVKHHMLHAAL